MAYPHWVDPPSGWKYGFPKIFDGEGSVNEWLIREGYPASLIKQATDEGWFYTRQWEVNDSSGH